MLTVFKQEGYRFYFYARVILETLEVTDSYKFNSKELKKIVKLVSENRTKIEGAWHEYFSR